MPDEPDLSDLYREVILDHYQAPRNRGEIPGVAVCEGANPLCGDEIRLTVKVEEGRVSDVRFSGRGCAISQASASMMTETVKGRPLAETVSISDRVKAVLKSEPGATMPEENGDLEALIGVRQYPVRIKCALLAWETLRQGLAREGAAAS